MLITPSPLTQSRAIGTPPLPEQIELHRDRMWRRDEDLRVESAVDTKRFIEDVGFANTLTDARRAGPSLYIEVCGSDVSLTRSNQKEAEGRREPEIRGLFLHRKTSSQEIIESRCQMSRCQTQRQLSTAIYLHRRRG